jgi:hypothetical protein
MPLHRKKEMENADFSDQTQIKIGLDWSRNLERCNLPVVQVLPVHREVQRHV